MSPLICYGAAYYVELFTRLPRNDMYARALRARRFVACSSAHFHARRHVAMRCAAPPPPPARCAVRCTTYREEDICPNQDMVRENMLRPLCREAAERQRQRSIYRQAECARAGRQSEVRCVFCKMAVWQRERQCVCVRAVRKVRAMAHGKGSGKRHGKKRGSVMRSVRRAALLIMCCCFYAARAAPFSCARARCARHK